MAEINDAAVQLAKPVLLNPAQLAQMEVTRVTSRALLDQGPWASIF